MSDSLDFDGRTALVTGGGSGIGAACVSMLSKRGANVIVADRNVSGLSPGERTRIEALDVSNTGGVTALFERLADERIVPDVLVNSAGIREYNDPLELSVADWAQVLAVNLTGTFLVAQAFARQLRARKRAGSIVNVASTSGIFASEHRAAYVSSKHGVVGLTRQLSLDLAPMGIRVNAVAPGVVRTPMTELYFGDPDMVQRLHAAYPLGRVAEPEDVAEVIVFLASNRARHVTGVVVPVDGGYTAGRRK